jgi:hypothetical protein
MVAWLQTPRIGLDALVIRGYFCNYGKKVGFPASLRGKNAIFPFVFISGREDRVIRIGDLNCVPPQLLTHTEIDTLD